MKTLHVALAGGLALVCVGGGAIAWASGNNTVVQPAAATQLHQLAAAPIDTTTESKFTPIAPCRAADTRVAGGVLHNTTTRNFYLGGTTFFVGQGGKSGGCGVPATATAVSVVVTAVSASHAGFLRAWRPGDTEPTASFMNYGTNFNASGTGAVSINSSGATEVRNLNAITQLVIDVNGYYMAPMTAYVGSNGALGHGSRVTNAFLISGNTSSYEVDFDRDVSKCTYALSSFYSGYDMTVEPRANVPNGVYVYTSYDHSPSADGFYLTVSC